MAKLHTDLLDLIHTPQDLKKLSMEQLPQLADDLRKTIIHELSPIGGHLGSGLGVVELTLALHYVLDTPRDKLIWDVGHQCYPHKLLTQRREQFSSIRQQHGLSGFTLRSESPYDPFGAGHSSTSISAGLGMALARDYLQKSYRIACVIGDGALSAGQAYEGLNNVPQTQGPFLIVLNDNNISIDATVGAFSHYLSHVLSSKPWYNTKDTLKNFFKKLPSPFFQLAHKAKEITSSILHGEKGNWFEDMGLLYIGPLNGHDLATLVPILQNIKDYKKPILLHVITQKGKGYLPAENEKNNLHGVTPFHISSGKKIDTQASITYTDVFQKTFKYCMDADSKIVAITAAMPSGTGLAAILEDYPLRVFDVGIAEQHAVTCAAGMAAEGLKPFVVIYSTFLQRACDQIIHDVALQKLPVRFAIDRAGFVGADGATHHGLYDVSFLLPLPHMVIMAPSDSQELAHMIYTAAHYDEGPIAFRYPRTSTILPDDPLQVLSIGKGRLLQEGNKIALLCIGTTLGMAQTVVKELKDLFDTPITLADARFIAPLDTDLITILLKNHHTLMILDEGVFNGFCANVFLFASTLVHSCKIIPLTVPRTIIEHGTRSQQLQQSPCNALSLRKIIENIV